MDDVQAPASDKGSVSAGGSKDAAAPAPKSEGTGQATVDGGKGSGNGTSTDHAPVSPEDYFSETFDPKTLPKELAPAYKQMQRAFTKKTETLARNKDKIEAYDAFMANPVEQLQKMAAQYGMTMTPAQARQAVQQAAENESWEPSSWEEVFAKMEERVNKKWEGRLKPVFQTVQEVTAKNIEKQLSEIDPNWQMYEDDMKDTLKKHPSLVSDVASLYRLSVPEDVQTGKAVQTALKKMEDKVKQAQVHSTGSQPKTLPAPKKAGSFAEAVEQAREQGKREGWYK